MVRKRKFVRSLCIRLTEFEYRLLVDYQRENGHATMSAAARDMIRRQGRYWRWKRSRAGERMKQEQELRNIAREILRDHPDASKGALGWNMVKRAGRIVDAEMIKRIAEEMMGSS